MEGQPMCKFKEECAPKHCPIVPEAQGAFARKLRLHLLIVSGVFAHNSGHKSS